MLLNNKNVERYQKAQQNKEQKGPMSNKRKKRSVIKLFFETVLEIIEDKQDSTIPVNVFCFLLMLYMLQIGGYTFQFNSLNRLKDEKMRTLGHLSEQSTGTYFLFMNGEESWIIWTFFIAQILMYTYIGYLLVITLVKRFLSEYWMLHTKKIRNIANRILNIYFLMYIWAISIPYLEVNSGVASCGDEGYLAQYNNDNCNNKPIIYTLTSVLGLVLTIGTILILLFFFRNYEFDDSILLKRRFKMIQVFLVCFYFLTIFSYFLKVLPSYFTFIFIEVIAVTYLFDSIINVPFKNEKIAKFYVTQSFLFLYLVNIFILWYYNIFIEDYDLLYTNLIISSLLYGLSSQIWALRFQQIMHITTENFEKNHDHLDFYLEQLYRLGQSSSISERDKFYLFELIIYHQSSCLDSECYCKITSFRDEKDNLIKEDLYKLIDSIFIWSLNQPIVQKNIENLEHLSLKFITYLTKYRNNSFRAYYYLKCITAKHESLSLYFKTLSSILSAKIEEGIIHQQLNSLRQKSNESQQMLQKKQISQIIEADEIEEKFLPNLIKFVSSKHEYYSQLKEQNLSLQQFSELTLQVCSRAISMKELYFQLFINHQNASILKKSYRISKVILKALMLNFSQNYSQKIMWRFNRIKKYQRELNTNILINEMKQMQRRLINQIQKQILSIEFQIIFLNQNQLKQIYSVVVLNELFASVQDELYLNDLIRNDQNKFIDQVSNICVLRGDVITLKVSISKSRGEIISNNLSKVASFFGYSQQDIFKIKNINSLMPNLFSDIHDYFINNSIQRGYSKLFESKQQTFAVDYQRLLIPINIYLSYSFDNYNDCCLSGTLVKRDTNHSYILFDQFGNIQGMTEKVFTNIFKTKPQKDNTEVDNLSPNSLLSSSQEKQAASHKIEQYFKTIEPSTVYQRFSIFLILPQIVRLIRKQYKEAEILSQITQNKDPNTNKFSVSLCLNKVYKIRIPYNYLELSNKLNQITNHSNFTKDKMLFSSKANKSQEIDFQSYYKSISSFYKRYAKFYEDSENCYKELDMVFNLQFFEYFYEQNHLKKARSFYCVEIIDILQNASDSRLNFLQKVAPLLDQTENPTTLENTIESSHFSYNKNQSLGQERFKDFSEEDKNENKKQKELKIVSQLIQDDDVDQEQKNELSPSILHQNNLNMQNSNTDSIVENPSHSNEQQASPYFQPQKPLQAPMLPLTQISTSDNILDKIKTDSTLTNKNNLKEKKNISKQITFEPTSSLEQTKTIQELIQEAKNKEIQDYVEIDEFYIDAIPTNKNKTQNQQNSNPKLNSKKYSSNIKLKNQSFQQKKCQDEDDNEYYIPSSETNNLEGNQTYQNLSIYNNVINNTYDRPNQSFSHLQQSNQNISTSQQIIDYFQNQSESNRKQDEYNFNQLEEYTSRNQRFDQSINTARAFMEIQNQEDTSTKNIYENLEYIHKNENFTQNSNKFKQNKTDLQRNQHQNDLKGFNKRESSDERQNKEQILIQHLNNKNSSQHSLSSMLNSSKNRLINFIHDSVYSHQIVKTFNSLAAILLLAFVTMIFVYSTQINNQLQSIQNSFESTQLQSNINQQYSNSLLMSQQLYQLKQGNLQNIPQIVIKKSLLEQQLTQSIQLYQENSNEYLSNLISNKIFSSESFQVTIYNNIFYLNQNDYKLNENRKKQEISVKNNLEYGLLNLINILQLQQTNNDNKIDENSYFYLLKNHFLFYEKLKGEQEIIFDYENSNQGNMQDFNIFTFSLTLIVYSLLCLSSAYLIHQIYIYKEKLLLTIARIHVQECEKYAFISKTIIQSLTDPSQSWLQLDFITLNFFCKPIQLDTQESPRKGNNINYNKTSPTNRKQKKSKRNQMISTSFTQQKLSKWKKTLLLFMICFICIMFFSIINLIVKNFYDNFGLPIHIHQESQQSIETILQIKTYSEILSTYRYLSKNQQDYPQLDFKEILNQYEEKIQEIQDYIPEFLNEFENLSFYSASQTQELGVIFKESLCYDSDYQEQQYKYNCKLFSETQRELYETGLSGIINRYLQLFNSNQQLYSNKLSEADHEKYLSDYQRSTDYFDLMIERSYEINNLLNSFKKIIANICSDYTSQLSYKVQLYCIIFGAILALFLLLGIIFSKIFLISQLRSLTFGLTLIPYSKLQEESTIQILKQISKS